MISRKATFVVGAITALVLASGGTAMAANGGSLVLGKSNKATKSTTLKNSKGTPLNLQAKSNYPPLKVNSSKRVDRLNADLLDGLSSEKFALAAGSTGYVAASGIVYSTVGDYIGIVAQPRCPAGTKVTGGGFSNLASGDVFVDRPDGSSTWRAATIGDLYYDTQDDLVGYAICYNPRGTVAGASRTLTEALTTDRLQRTGKIAPDALEVAKLTKVAAR